MDASTFVSFCESTYRQVSFIPARIGSPAVGWLVVYMACCWDYKDFTLDQF